MTINLDKLERHAKSMSGLPDDFHSRISLSPNDVLTLIAKAREADTLTARVATLEAAGDRLKGVTRAIADWGYQAAVDPVRAWNALRNGTDIE